jgi:hypothetical protein
MVITWQNLISIGRGGFQPAVPETQPLPLEAYIAHKTLQILTRCNVIRTLHRNTPRGRDKYDAEFKKFLINLLLY